MMALRRVPTSLAGSGEDQQRAGSEAEADRQGLLLFDFVIEEVA